MYTTISCNFRPPPSSTHQSKLVGLRVPLGRAARNCNAPPALIPHWPEQRRTDLNHEVNREEDAKDKGTIKVIKLKSVVAIRPTQICQKANQSEPIIIRRDLLHLNLHLHPATADVTAIAPSDRLENITSAPHQIIKQPMPRGFNLPLRHLRQFTSTSTSTSTPARMAPIERITLFNVPKAEDRKRLLEQYKVLAKTATKVCSMAPSQPIVHTAPFGKLSNCNRTASRTSSPRPSANPSTTPAIRASISLLRLLSLRWMI